MAAQASSVAQNTSGPRASRGLAVRRRGVGQHRDDADAIRDRAGADVDLRDSDLDETAESHTELLARHLGAEVIAEEDGGA